MSKRTARNPSNCCQILDADVEVLITTNVIKDKTLGA